MTNDLNLPPVIEGEHDDGPYGSYHVAACHAGYDKLPCPAQGLWQHGWVPRHSQINPSYVCGQSLTQRDRNRRIWVARKDEADFLKQRGFSKARAIGHPIVYTGEEEVRRTPQSLLVMPMHSLDYTRHQWNFETYAEQIQGIRDDFAEVMVCIHPSCLKHGYWVSEFEKRGFEIISGASFRDLNSLKRMQRLFRRFEFVTTNGLGSQIPYAAYFGAKPSFFGEYASLREEDFSRAEFYASDPEMLQAALHRHSESFVRKNLPQFFVEHPSSASDVSQWGRDELGSDNMLSANELNNEFGWRLPRRLLYQGIHVVRSNRLLKGAYRLIRRQDG